MEKKLVKKFYIGFLALAIMYGLLIIGFTIGSIIAWINYTRGKEELFMSILVTAVLLTVSIIFIVYAIPSFRDLTAVRQRKFERIIGTIVRYNKVEHGGEPPTHGYYTVVKDNITGKEVELSIVNRREKEIYNPLIKEEIVVQELFGTYNFIYLKHTKLAVIDDSEIKKD
ncbi:MAG: hypothetical protein LBT20_05255 [Clostridiales bacterium]|jgi:hypothetical protein|nr:hypothetical protein [Clostridiales bacterium]